MQIVRNGYIINNVALPQYLGDFMRDVIIKHAEAKDWDAAIAVAWVTFQQIASQVSNEEAANTFREGLTSTQLYIEFLQGRYPVFCAYKGQKVIGVLSMRNESHISLLFVRREFQRKGIGVKLLEQCKEYCKSKGIETVTVNAIATGVPFYAANGFEAVEAERVEHGLGYTPMRLNFKR